MPMMVLRRLLLLLLLLSLLLLLLLMMMMMAMVASMTTKMTTMMMKIVACWSMKKQAMNLLNRMKSMATIAVAAADYLWSTGRPLLHTESGRLEAVAAAAVAELYNDCEIEWSNRDDCGRRY